MKRNGHRLVGKFEQIPQTVLCPDFLKAGEVCEKQKTGAFD